MCSPVDVSDVLVALGGVYFVFLVMVVAVLVVSLGFLMLVINGVRFTVAGIAVVVLVTSIRPLMPD